MKNLIKCIFLVASVLASSAQALVCTTNAGTGSWGTNSTWSCGRVPTNADTVVISRAITLSNNYTIAGLTINSGITFNDGNRTLAINGDLTNNGTITGGGDMNVTGAAAIISGNGTYTNSRLYVSGATTTIASGAILNFSGSSRLYAGRNEAGTTFAASVLTINGTINSTVATATTNFMRLYGNSTVIGSTGVINAAVSAVTFNTSTATVTNNGSVSVNIITQNAATNSWTQGAGSNLTVTATSTVGVLYASASGNTVTYTSPAVPIAPNANTYFNLGGTGVTCPHAFTVTGSDPCSVPGVTSVTLNPGTCVDDATVGATTWGAGLTNVGLSDNLYATSVTAALTGTQLTHYLKCTNYGFAIPVGATINGIAVKVERKISSTTRTTAKDNSMRIVQGGVIGATNRATATVYTAADVPEMHGGIADLWGLAWTPADINAVTFGAAFSASVTTTRANSRTVSVDHMPITVTYTAAAAAPHHIQIDHDGGGQTCRAETLTVTACANAACTAPHFTAANVSGNVTWAGTPGGSLPFTIASGGTGQTTVLLPVTTAQTVTLGTSAVSPAQTNPPSACVNAGGGAACNLVFSAATACFDAVETGSTTTPLFTKLSGSAFSLDILAGSTYSGTLQVELVNASSGTCATYTSLNTQSTTFTSQTRKTLNFAYANAARDVKVRITGLAASSCSSGRLAIRPQSLTVTSNINADATGSSASATPVLKTGTTFTLNAATAVAGYDGTPKVDNTKLVVHSGAVANGTVSGVFGAASAATGLATGSSFSYDEVGYFRADVDGVYDDTFTAIDSAAGDCTNDFSNTLVGGKYGCKFGNAAASAYFGRFIPDHFAVTQAPFENHSALCNAGVLISDGVTACDATFNYMDEQMDAIFTLGAVTQTGALTRNYDGTFARLNPIATNSTLAWAAVDAAAPTNLTARLDTALVAANGTGSFISGSADISVPLKITRGAAADGPYSALKLGIVPTDSDGVTAVFDMDTNADAVMDHAQVNSAVTEVRYGRLRVSNTYGKETSRLPVSVFAQYYSGGSWLASTTDNVTKFNTATDLTATNFKSPLAAVTAYNAGNITLVKGVASFSLAAPGVTGSADIGLSVPTYLPSVTGRATFGVYKGANQFIYMREAY